MKNLLDRTHDSKVRSWVTSANDPGCDFPIQNLPLGVFQRASQARIGVAIGDHLLDLHGASSSGLLPELDASVRDALAQPVLNPLMAMGRDASSLLRNALFDLLREDSPNGKSCASHLHAQRDVTMLLPASIGDYTDFYASIYHATNVGSMFRPDNPLLPNYKWVPIGYHGRASSIVASGAAVPRPSGQLKADDAEAPTFAPSKRLDYELEVGVFIGAANIPGGTIPIGHATDHAFGLCLVNDWSARDMQAWEYQPLGPFLAKNFLTTISPWVVTMDAIAPFRAPAFRRDENDPRPLPYLLDENDQQAGGLDLALEVWLQSEKMRTAGLPPQRLTRGNFRDMYWTLAQLIAHHASNGCNLRPGDLLASGTVSGAAKDSRGCLLELAWRGAEPVTLVSGEQRRFLEDGDEVVLRGYCERDGAKRIGFGECRGRIRSA